MSGSLNLTPVKLPSGRSFVSIKLAKKALVWLALTRPAVMILEASPAHHPEACRSFSVSPLYWNSIALAFENKSMNATATAKSNFRFILEHGKQQAPCQYTHV